MKVQNQPIFFSWPKIWTTAHVLLVNDKVYPNDFTSQKAAMFYSWLQLNINPANNYRKWPKPCFQRFSSFQSLSEIQHGCIIGNWATQAIFIKSSKKQIAEYALPKIWCLLKSTVSATAISDLTCASVSKQVLCKTGHMKMSSIWLKINL